VLVKLDIDGLVMLHIHEVKGRATSSDQGEVSLVGGIVKSAKVTIIDTEAILPDVKNSFLRFGV
jgi:hypothetical protein